MAMKSDDDRKKKAAATLDELDLQEIAYLIELLADAGRLRAIIHPYDDANFIVNSDFSGVMMSGRHPGVYGLIVSDCMEEMAAKAHHMEVAPPGHSCDAGDKDETPPYVVHGGNNEVH
jgi:hypothetical protein